MTETILETRDDLADAVMIGLAQPQKVIPARFFYDRRGSELFEEITRLPEYYPTRIETGLLRNHAGDIARLIGDGRTVVEFGSGSSTKTPLLLDAVKPRTYVAIDISGEFLEHAAAGLAAAHPEIKIVPVAGDFTGEIRLPELDGPLIGFFPGSTIGNFAHRDAVRLLASFRSALGDGARFVIGIDLKKNPRLLEAAYDDSAGVTAAFNLNLLRRLNRELDGSIDIDAFEHRAWWHAGKGRIEMHLMAMRDLRFSVAGRSFSMREGETIHTENSYKYTIDEARFMARASGWEPLAAWMDADQLFSLHVWSAAPEAMEP